MTTLAPLVVTPAHNLSKSARAEAAGVTNHDAAQSPEIPRGDVTATLNYYQAPEDGAVPFNYVEEPPAGQPARNYGEAKVQVTVHDIRGHEDDYTLDRDAFKVIRDVPVSAEKDFISDESIEKNYYPEVEKLVLENVPGSTRVVFFDHTIRRAHPNAARNPVTRVHIDQTASSAKERVRRHLGDEAEELLQGRYRIINVWRPLNGPVVSFPLAFASSASVEDEDLVPIEQRYPDRTGRVAGVRHSDNHKWSYLSGMRNDERIMLECFDSEALNEGTQVQGGRVPHTAFVDPRTPTNAPLRESIEVRTLVFGP